MNNALLEIALASLTVNVTGLIAQIEEQERQQRRSAEEKTQAMAQQAISSAA